MQVFDIKSMPAFPMEERAKNVFYSSEKFKARVIELEPQGRMPSCEMTAEVIFYIAAGTVEITVNDENQLLSEGECLIAPPGTFSMYSPSGVRILGIQIF